VRRRRLRHGRGRPRVRPRDQQPHDRRPDGGTGETQGQSESWSDLIFAAYFQEFAISSGEGVDPVVLGPVRHRRHDLRHPQLRHEQSPLTFGELEYDGNGLTSPHANGEIWSATNYDIFTALAKKYDARTRQGRELQRSCARGEKDAPTARATGAGTRSVRQLPAHAAGRLVRRLA
jgi:hypothetical protein